MNKLMCWISAHLGNMVSCQLEEQRHVLERYHAELVNHSYLLKGVTIDLARLESTTNEVRQVQMDHESLLVSLKSDIDRLTHMVEALDLKATNGNRTLQQLQKKANGA